MNTNCDSKIKSQTYEVTHYKGLEGLLALKSDWQGLFAKCRNMSFYNHWCWHYCVAKHLIEHNLSYFLIRKHGEPVAIIPLEFAAMEKGGVQWQGYRLPRHNHINLVDILIADGSEYDDIIDFFTRFLRWQKDDKWHLLSLMKFARRSNVYPRIETSGHNAEVVNYSACIRCGGGTPLTERLSRKHLKNVERLRKKAEAVHGPLELKIVDTPAELDSAFETFLQVESSGWKGQAGEGSSIDSDPNLEAFYRELMDAFAVRGNAAINLLYFNDKAVAGQFCIKAGSSWNLLKIGYDEAYQAFAPGNILLKWFIETVNQSEAVCEINLVTNPVWAERWHFEKEPVYQAEYYNHTPMARLLAATTKGRHVWRKIRKDTGSLSEGTLK